MCDDGGPGSEHAICAVGTDPSAKPPALGFPVPALGLVGLPVPALAATLGVNTSALGYIVVLGGCNLAPTSTLDSISTVGVDMSLGYILVLGETNATLRVRFRM